MNRREFFRSSAVPVAGLALAGGTLLPLTTQASSAFSGLSARHCSALEAYNVALKLRDEALARAEAMAPASPDALLLRAPWGHQLEGEIEQTVDWRYCHDRKLSTVRDLEQEVELYDGRRRIGREVRRRLPIARAYEAGMARARDASGFSAAETARFWAALALMKLADEAFALKAETMADVAVKARIFKTAGFCDVGAPHQIATRYGLKLAEDVDRLAAGQS